MEGKKKIQKINSMRNHLKDLEDFNKTIDKVIEDQSKEDFTFSDLCTLGSFVNGRINELKRLERLVVEMAPLDINDLRELNILSTKIDYRLSLTDEWKEIQKSKDNS